MKTKEQKRIEAVVRLRKHFQAKKKEMNDQLDEGDFHNTNVHVVKTFFDYCVRAELDNHGNALPFPLAYQKTLRGWSLAGGSGWSVDIGAVKHLYFPSLLDY